MNDMRVAIVPKSDQLNADDLIAGPLTITIKNVSIRQSTEQPVSIHFEGDNGKPYKPCKSMSRVMVHAWGPDANQYAGKSMTLYRDPSVKWGGVEIGGIRISHMSHIKGDETMALTATKGSRKLFTVKPLQVQASAAASVFGTQTSKDWIAAQATVLAAMTDAAALEAWKTAEAPKISALGQKQKEWLDGKIAEATTRLSSAPPSDTAPADPCATCNGTGVIEDATGKGPCADCQGG